MPKVVYMVHALAYAQRHACPPLSPHGCSQ